jgi:hypothetical protein
MWGSTIGGIVTLILSLLTAPLTSTAQQAANVPRLGLLIPGSSSAFAPRIEAFTGCGTSGTWRAGTSLSSPALPKGRLTGSPHSWRS